mmetsp:Transcript_16213/g.38171  ORF Transcript_16213/g.38171 Transcript_16213/m.38171 type:complete len:87 (+) Transcript_16213:2977-3237(+)
MDCHLGVEMIQKQTPTDVGLEHRCSASGSPKSTSNPNPPHNRLQKRHEHFLKCKPKFFVLLECKTPPSTSAQRIPCRMLKEIVTTQ